MELNHYVIHELVKEPNSAPRLILSQSLPTSNAISRNLIIELNERYKQRETYGRFTPASQSVFPLEFAKYATENFTSEPFLIFTHLVMQSLMDQIQNISTAKGGFLVFADYITNYGNYMSVFFVRNTSGFIFNEANSVYDVVSQIHVETEKLAMGCKINKVKYNSTDGGYLSFIRTNKQDTSNYFINWIAATELKHNSEYTKKLCQIIRLIDIPEINGAKPDRDEFQKLIYYYCSGLPGGKLSLVELGAQFYGEENQNKIIDFAHENDIQIAAEFRPLKANLKKLYRVDVSADNITLRFDYDALDVKVRVEQTRIIIESRSLADEIRQEMTNAS